jgi:hypothetical protein
MNPSRVLAAGLMAAAALATPAAAQASTAAAPPAVAPLDACVSPALSQPLLALKDANLYTLAPGGAFEPGSTGGWQLAGGASFVQTTQADGSSGGVLDLPSRATATSPPMCITSDYPTARLHVRNIVGAEGVFFNVQYWRNGAWTNPKDTGQFHGAGNAWSLSGKMNIQPAGTAGWQQVRFTFLGGGNTSRFQVDDFWVDPRAKF